MKSLFQFVKTTALGGAVFLVPLVVGGYLVTKVLVGLRELAAPFVGVVPTDTPLGVLLVDLCLFGVLLLICFLAGVAAKSAAGRRLGDGIERKLLGAVPGYGFLKGLTDSLASSDEQSRSFKPVLARFDDSAVLAFEVERGPRGGVVVYLPGAPNPWSGSLAHVEPARVQPLDLSMTQAIKLIQQLGRGGADLAVVEPAGE